MTNRRLLQVPEMRIISKAVTASEQRTTREAISFRELLPPHGQVRFRSNHGQQHADDIVLKLLEERQAKRPAAYVRLLQRQTNHVDQFAAKPGALETNENEVLNMLSI